MEKQFWTACSDGKLKEVKRLLSINPRCDVNYRHNNNWTSFGRACCEGHIEIVKFLLNDKRVDVNKASYNGWTPFHIAVHRGHLEIVKLLFNNQKVNTMTTTNDTTPFHTACENGHLEIVKLLLSDQRVDVNQVNNDGSTALHFVCRYGYLEIAEYILASGKEVDLNIKNNREKTGLDIANERNDGRGSWQNDERFQRRESNCIKIVELFESFERNPNETRVKLRLKLGLAGKIFFF